MLHKKKLAVIFLLASCFLPLCWRLTRHGLEAASGLCSDIGLAMLVLTLALYFPHWLRVPLMILWALTQIIGQELLSTMQRLPAWQDLHYLTDANFIANTTAGFKLAEFPLSLLFCLFTLPLVFLPTLRPRKRWLPVGLALVLVFFCLHDVLNKKDSASSMAARYNPLHWFAQDVLTSTLLAEKPTPALLRAKALKAKMVLPSALKELDLAGESLLGNKGKATNVLIIVLEGIPGLYYPEIRQAMGIDTQTTEMPELVAATPDAMLIPDFVVHSHQTIRGLYSILCGDFSKLSWKTPKALDLQQNSDQAQQCLPAQMAQHGWSTHFLQGAGLTFMNKDRVMPLIGFQQVHGLEWFTQPNPFPFTWGPVDEVFFNEAFRYVSQLQQEGKPWMLTLLNVGTHQPYGVSDAEAAQYPSRKLASVALLDKAVGTFLKKLKDEGVLDNTLLVIVPDESHGSDFGDWTSAWGMAMVLAPEQKQLPRIKEGGYGLVDVEASILDYLDLPAPPRISGRSFFRDYTTPREMLSFTASKVRWHRANNLRYECTENGQCWVARANSLLGPLITEMEPDNTGCGQRIPDIVSVLDNKLLEQQNATSTMHFGHDEARALPEKMGSAWADNLIGAQYLDFPEHSKVEVRIKIRALAAPPDGIRLCLNLKSWDKEVHDIVVPEFPILHKGQETSVAFSFDNRQARHNFSFHLLGEGLGGVIQIDIFDIHIMRE